MWKWLKRTFGPPEPPKIEEKPIMCPQCRKLHMAIHINGTPLGNTRNCEDCILKSIDAIFDKFEEMEKIFEELERRDG